MNEYVLDAGTNSGTDWVVTMPTKRFYVGLGDGTPCACSSATSTRREVPATTCR